MERFSTHGYGSVNPLLTFRCLSNMPAFHVSVNFDLQGPYFVSYPGPGQFYQALEEARAALAERRVDVALVLGVAHQQNFLVRHHFSRLVPPELDRVDAAGCLVLERPGAAASRGAAIRGRLVDCRCDYRPFNPFEESVAPEEAGADRVHGPASLPVALATAAPGPLRHTLRSRDGIVASSLWERSA